MDHQNYRDDCRPAVGEAQGTASFLGQGSGGRPILVLREGGRDWPGQRKPSGWLCGKKMDSRCGLFLGECWFGGLEFRVWLSRD